MTLIFNNHSFNYEIESVCKLFFTGMLFQHEYNSNDFDRDDLIVTELEQNEQETKLTAVVHYQGKTATEFRTVQTNTADYENRCERMLATAVYDALSVVTGMIPPWGIMTGIRPVKQYHYLLEQGNTPQEAASIFVDDFFVSPVKLRICQQISNIQRPIIDASAAESYSLYVSIPFCPSRCSYCSFVSSSISNPKAKALLEDYLEKLFEELQMIGDLAKRFGLKLETVYIGGGTPTTLTAEQLDRLMDCLHRYFPMEQAKEFTVEAGRADTITREKLEVIRRWNATRISINPQSFSDEVLHRIGRKHTAKQVLDCYQMALDCGLTDINMDFIAGLPGDTLETFQHSIDQAIALNPTNITVHTLTIKRSSDLFADGTWQEQQDTARMVEYAYDTLSAAGYVPYYLYRQKNTLQNLENVGYCKPGLEGLYNIYIMEEIHTILAAGAGAVSKLIRKKSQKVERIFNYKYPFEYNKGFAEMMKRKEAMESFYCGDKTLGKN